MATPGHLTKIVSEKIGCFHPSCKDLECCSTTKIKMTTSLLNKAALSYGNAGKSAKKKMLKRTDDVVILSKSDPHNRMPKPKKHFKKFVNPNLVRIQTKNVKTEKPEGNFKTINNTMNNVNAVFGRKLNYFSLNKSCVNPFEKHHKSAPKNVKPVSDKYQIMIPTPLEGSIDSSNSASGVKGQHQEQQRPRNFGIVNRQTFFRMCHNFNISTRHSEFKPIPNSKVESSAKFENQQFILDTLKNLSAIFDGRFDVSNIPRCPSPDFEMSTPCDNFEVSCLIKEMKNEFLINLKTDCNLAVTPIEIENALSDEIWQKTVNLNINQAFS